MSDALTFESSNITKWLSAPLFGLAWVWVWVFVELWHLLSARFNVDAAADNLVAIVLHFCLYTLCIVCAGLSVHFLYLYLISGSFFLLSIRNAYYNPQIRTHLHKHRMSNGTDVHLKGDLTRCRFFVVVSFYRRSMSILSLSFSFSRSRMDWQ